MPTTAVAKCGGQILERTRQRVRLAENPGDYFMQREAEPHLGGDSAAADSRDKQVEPAQHGPTIGTRKPEPVAPPDSAAHEGQHCRRS